MKFGLIELDGQSVLSVAQQKWLVPLVMAPIGLTFVRGWSVEGLHGPLHRLVHDALSGAVPRSAWLDPAEAVFLPPVPDCRTVIAIGLNYASHCAEQGKKTPLAPMFFAKLPSCLAAHRQPVIRWPITSQLDFEGELAVVIGRGGRAIPESEALSRVFGYSVFNDVTARDLQRADRQWVRGKSLDTFGPMGPLITTADDVPDPQNLHLQTRVNGEIRQDACTSEMAFSVARIVAHVSEAITLCPGDIITTGTPAGVGLFCKPPRFLVPGDCVEITIEGLGTLHNAIAAPS